MENVRQFLKKDKFAEHCGIELLEIGDGRAKGRMAITARHLNGLGIVQGGAVFTLADFVFAAASNSHGTVAVAINVSISFVKAVSSGTLFAEGHEISLNPKLATYRVDVMDDRKEIVAVFQGMVYRKQDKI